MKKLLLAATGFAFAFSLTAQDTPKKVQVGMAYQLGLNFNKPGTKIIERDGVGVQNSIGLNVNFNFTDNIGLATGLEFDFESFKYNIVSPDPLYYRYIDSKILQKEEGTDNTTLYHLTNRKQKAIYGTVPVMLRFRTNAIGSFRYYGKFGTRLSFLLNSSAYDKGFNVDITQPGAPEAAFNNDNVRTKGDLVFFRSTIGVAAGTEWNFTGSTVLFAELGFYYGFTPIHYGKAITGNDEERDMTLFTNTAGTDDYTTFSAKQKQFVLKIGILF